MIVGAEALSHTEITELSRRDQSTGRFSIDVAVDPAVHQLAIQCHPEQIAFKLHLNVTFRFYRFVSKTTSRLTRLDGN